MDVTFEWDDMKRTANVEKHGLDFADAPRLFDSPMLLDIDDREVYEETRWIGFGLLDGRVVAVVFAEPDPGTVRIISMRAATSRERRMYEREIRDRLGQG
jgi:uncharacterized DUF497 family protein